MKNLYIIVFALFIASSQSCKSKTSSVTKDTIIRDTTAINPDIETQGIPVDYDHIKVIKTVYVTDRNGLIALQQTDLKSKKLVKYEYGDKLDVIETKGDWLGIMDRVTREYQKNGSDQESSAWEKIYIKANKTGNIADIKLVADDLNIIINDDENDKKTNRLSGFLDMSLVDKKEYDAAKSTAADYLMQDTLNIRKKNGVIELPYGNKTRRYVDKPDAEDQTEVFTYVGNIPFLNKYVLSGTYYESFDYKLIDKTTGEETASLNSLPNISADRKYLIALTANSYEPAGWLELYSISDKKIKMALNINFKNWMPAGDDDSAFFGVDGNFYVQALHTKAFWTADGKLNNRNYQYLKIRVK